MPPTAPSPVTFRILRLLAGGNFRSGEELARALRVSRTTVWKALQNLEQWGVILFKVHGRGYRLVTPIDWLDPKQIQHWLGAHADALQVHLMDTVDSTNSLLLEEARVGAPSGLALAAELQTRGRGRRGRVWHTGLGDALTFSLLWRFDGGVSSLHGLSLAVSLALVRALRRLGGTDVMVKWPNDILWRGQKLAGVLIEVQGDANGPTAAVIGVGINVRLDERLRNRIGQPVADLVDAGIGHGRNRVLGEVLCSLADVLALFSAQGFEPFSAEWERCHLLAGQPVALLLPDGAEARGTVTGVDEDGALLLQTSTGLCRFHSGEVTVRAAQPLRRMPTG